MSFFRKLCCFWRCCCCCSCCCRRRKSRYSHQTNSRVESYPVTEKKIRVMALFDFSQRSEEDLEFKRGDRLIVVDNSGNDWWRARHTITGEEGTIPSNFVRELESKPENHEAWYHIVRREANFLLSHTGAGTFLLRPYVNLDAHCTLSVCAKDDSGGLTYKHYKVLVDPDGVYRFCHRRESSDFFQLLDDHREPVECDCGTVLTKACFDKTSSIIQGMQIPREKVRVDYSLGGGFFGEVWHGYLESMEVAVKMLKSDRVPTDSIIQDFKEEARKMCQIKHSNVVQLLGVCMDDGPVLLVMEYLSRGSLLQHLRDDAGNFITFGRLCNMLSMVSDGMDYVGSTLKIVHRDLRAANILVSENLTVKVADFGLARDAEYWPTTFQLPIRWTAPEAFSADGLSVKADVWSFGILSYEVITYGRVPYSDMSKDEVKSAVAEGYRLENPHGLKIIGGRRMVECPQPVYDRMLECWRLASQERPTFAFLTYFFGNHAGLADMEYLNAEEVV